MAAIFGTTNTERYYTVPDNATLTLPDGDWSIIQAGKVSNVQGVPKYCFSTNTVTQVESANMFVSDTNVLNFYLEAFTGQFVAQVVTYEAMQVRYACRRSNTLYVGYANAAGSATVNETNGLAVSTASNGTSYIIGGRNDLHVDRMWRGTIAWHAHVGGYGVTATDIQNIAQGAGILNNANITTNYDAFWHFNTAAATVTDSVNSYVATRVGTGWSDEVDDPLIVPTGSGGGAIRGVQFTWQDASQLVGANLSNIQLVWFDEPEVKDWATIRGQTATATTNGSGLIQVNLESATSLALGGTGCLVALDRNPGNPKLSQYVIGEFTIVDIQ